MAINSFAIAATSCDLERVFSDTGDLLDSTMARMSAETLKMRVCLQQWLKDGLIEGLQIE